MKVEQILGWNVTIMHITSIKRNFAALVFHVCDAWAQSAVKMLGPGWLENNSLLHKPTSPVHLQASSVIKELKSIET
jgi:hypothetical protein